MEPAILELVEFLRTKPKDLPWKFLTRELTRAGARLSSKDGSLVMVSLPKRRSIGLHISRRMDTGACQKLRRWLEVES